MQHPPICCIWSSAKPPLDSENLEKRQRPHGLCKEADGEGQRAQHRRNMPMAEIVGPERVQWFGVPPVTLQSGV
jgi:hypothetical protein